MLSAAPSKKRRAVLQIGFETCANLLLRRHNYYSGIRAVLASLASSNTEISCLIHVASVLFFYGGGEGLRILLSKLPVEAISHRGCFRL